MHVNVPTASDKFGVFLPSRSMQKSKQISAWMAQPVQKLSSVYQFAEWAVWPALHSSSLDHVKLYNDEGECCEGTSHVKRKGEFKSFSKTFPCASEGKTPEL